MITLSHIVSDCNMISVIFLQFLIHLTPIIKNPPTSVDGQINELEKQESKNIKKVPNPEEVSMKKKCHRRRVNSLNMYFSQILVTKKKENIFKH